MSYLLLNGKIRALEPIHIGTGVSIGTFLETKDYITAKAIRGMLGNYLFNENRELFERTRISDDASPTMFFKPALPYGQRSIPNIVKWCKRCGSLILKGEDGEEKTCANCGHEGKKRSGWFEIGPEHTLPKMVESKKVHKTISTKCPINPIRHSSYLPTDDGYKSPYNVEAILPGTQFDFRMVLQDDYVDDIKNALKEAGIFYGVGGLRSKGYGSIDIEFIEEKNAGDYIESNANRDRSAIMVSNNELILRSEKGYLRYFDENLIREYISKTLSHTNMQLPIEFSVKEQRSPTPSLARGWDMKAGYKLMNLRPAIGPGSSARITANPELMAFIELFGLGEDHHIFGDTYFINEVVQ